MSNINKKRKIYPDKYNSINTNSVKREKMTPLYGREFNSSIDRMNAISTHSAYTRVDIPLSYDDISLKKSKLHLEATFSTKTQNSINDISSWSQGWMEMIGETSYEKILPESLSLDQSIIESRVMKKLVMGDIYKPNRTHLSLIDEKQFKEKTKNWGRPSLQSYLEDITGRVSLGVQDIGSSIRADILTAKLKMKNSNSTSSPDFRKNMYENFPQLLTKRSKPKKGGASYYNKNINDEQKIHTGPTPTQKELYNPVIKSHRDINRETRIRFNNKWDKIQNNTLSTKEAGKWWTNKFGDLRGHTVLSSGKSSTPGLSKRALRRDYVRTKLARHNINHYK